MMRPRLLLFVVLALFAGAWTALPSSAAVGTVDLSWNSCSPLVPSLSRGAPGPVSMYASVTGHDVPHSAYQISLYFYAPYFPSYGPLGDSWRFDAAGCQGSGRLDLRHTPLGAVATACPPFQGPGTDPGLQIKDFSFSPISGRARLSLANSYPGGVTDTDPAKRYFLMSATFDHTSSVVGTGTPGVTCGWFEQDILISYFVPCDGRGCGTGAPPSWLDLGGTQHDFLIGQGSLTFCGSCEPAPAASTTWGAIKAVYRR